MIKGSVKRNTNYRSKGAFSHHTPVGCTVVSHSSVQGTGKVGCVTSLCKSLRDRQVQLPTNQSYQFLYISIFMCEV